MASEIKYLLNAAIDKLRWDECIAKAGNGLVYAKSYYLDHTALTWDALVEGDYKAVMPLPLRRKFGIRYLFQAPFTPVLGVFGNNLTAENVQAFLKQIPSTVKFWDYSLNHFNTIDEGRYPVYPRQNLVLPLQKTYDELRSAYHENTLRNLRKAVTAGLQVYRQIPISNVIELARIKFAEFSSVSADFWERLPSLITDKRHQFICYGVKDTSNKLLASAIFLIDGHRAYYWLAGNAPDARKSNASFLLVDTFIKDHAGSGLVLDFEGSDTAGIAMFYERFGAISEPYSTIFYNRLPVWLRGLKKVPEDYKRYKRKKDE